MEAMQRNAFLGLPAPRQRRGGEEAMQRVALKPEDHRGGSLTGRLSSAARRRHCVLPAGSPESSGDGGSKETTILSGLPR